MEAFDDSIRKKCGIFTHAERARLGGVSAPRSKKELKEGVKYLLDHSNPRIADYGEDFIKKDVVKGAEMMRLHLERDNAVALNPFDRPNWEELGIKERFIDQTVVQDDMVAKIVIERFAKASREDDVRDIIYEIIDDVSVQVGFDKLKDDDEPDPLIKEVLKLQGRIRSGGEIQMEDLDELKEVATRYRERKEVTEKAMIEREEMAVEGELKEGAKVSALTELSQSQLIDAYKYAVDNSYGADSFERREMLRELGLPPPSAFKRMPRRDRVDTLEKLGDLLEFDDIIDFVRTAEDARRRDERRDFDREDERIREMEREAETDERVEEREEFEEREEEREQAPRRRPVEIDEVDDVVDEMVEETVEAEGSMRMRDVDNPFIDDTPFYDQDVFRSD